MEKVKTKSLVGLALMLLFFNGFAQKNTFKINQVINASDITPSASSNFGAAQDVSHLTDGSGIKNNIHDANGGAQTIWHTAENPTASNPTKGLPTFNAWTRFDFKTAKSINKLLVWNHNQQNLTNRGFRLTKVYGTKNGTDWVELAALELPKARGGKATEIPIKEIGVLKAVIIAAESNWGANVYGLSEVKFLAERELNESAMPFPSELTCTSTYFYRYDKAGKPAREVVLRFKGENLYQSAEIALTAEGKTATTTTTFDKNGISTAKVLLPSGVGEAKDVEVSVQLKAGKKVLNKSFSLPKQRQWTVMIYPHSHVDIGYTNTQTNVEIIHRGNLINGIELAKKTANYPKEARFVWNPEVLWPVERYMKNATPTQKHYIIDAIQKGYLRLDASYCNTNTSVAADEEMFEFLNYSKEFEKLTGEKIKTYVQVDVPGMSWGIVPVAAKQGVKYIFAFNNGVGRFGNTMSMSFKPFWWKSIDGKSKILFLQPGSYTPGATAKGMQLATDLFGETDTVKLLKEVKTANPREHFIDQYLSEKLPELEKADYYPYDVFAMSWALADNTPIDADLPDAVKSWNEEYAFPRLVIAGATDIMQTFEQKYGDQLPVLSGDFTETWTDGLGTAAKQASMNRNAKERLIQDETLWTMVNPGKPAPRAEIKEAWRNVALGTEHTWCYITPEKQPITNDILKVKFSYFQTAEEKSKALMVSALAAVNENESSTFGVFNTLSWSRSGLVYVPAVQSEKFSGVTDEKGKIIPSQKLFSGELVFMATDIPAFGSKNYVLTNQKTKVAKALVQDNILDNGIVRLIIDKQTGDISSLTYGSKEFVDKKASIGLNGYRHIFGKDKPEKATGTSNVQLSIKENGPLLATVLVESQAGGLNSLTREVTIIAGQAHIELKNIVDKQPVIKKEGLHFGFAFNINNPITRVDIPWGVMQVEKDQLSGANRNWLALERWLDVSNNAEGVTWCSLDAPVFEHGDITANILGYEPFSPIWIEKLDPSATVYSWALNNYWDTNFPLSQEGKVTFRYRILPHNMGYDAGKSNRFGMEQAAPLIAAPVNKGTESKPLLALEGSDKVLVTILKTDETGNNTKIRIRSVSDKDETVKLNWLSRKPESVTIVDDLEVANKTVQGEIVVPAMGFITIEAKFGK